MNVIYIERINSLCKLSASINFSSKMCDLIGMINESSP